MVHYSSLANYHLWWVFTQCKASANCYGKYATITSSLLLWFNYYSHSKGTCVTAKHSLDSLMCFIIQWYMYVHCVKRPDFSRNTLCNDCNNTVSSTGVADLKHAWVGLEAVGAELVKVNCNQSRFRNCNCNKVWPCILICQLLSTGKDFPVTVCKNHPTTLHPHTLLYLHCNTSPNCLLFFFC